jgi:hypothetical protein
MMHQQEDLGQVKLQTVRGLAKVELQAVGPSQLCPFAEEFAMEPVRCEKKKSRLGAFAIGYGIATGFAFLIGLYLGVGL